MIDSQGHCMFHNSQYISVLTFSTGFAFGFRSVGRMYRVNYSGRLSTKPQHTTAHKKSNIFCPTYIRHREEAF